eukprot:TRINITY_DN10293_c0_g1_i1.p1 TRINITY_DN10293_c0_g1~~TRINITY_DN10293_c0_g1_i1.p1  ORF type:complete len:620 (-),score=175.77 TRINITY_DN10293_c0_g1_i1:4-1863(-)
MLQAALSRFIWHGDGDEENEEEKTYVPPNVEVGTPFGVTHKVHVNKDFQWSGTADPTEVFNLEDKIGEGSFGSVWKAKQRDSQFTLAIKIITLRGAEKADEGITHEINILKACNHTNIVSYFGSCFNGNDLWILMDYCAVGSVEDLMVTNQKTLSERQIAFVCLSSLKGLEYLHNYQKIIHRDIKAANILLTEAGEVKLADFGVSQTLSSALLSSDAIVGTPLFVSPEVVKDKLYTNKQDIWALGITMIEMADGYPPYIDMNPVRAMYSIPHRSPPTVAVTKDWSKGFLEFLNRCLTKDHLTRPSAIELLRDAWIIDFMMSGSKDVLRELIINAILEKEKKPSDGGSESGGSEGYLTKLSETMRTRREEESESPTPVREQENPMGTSIVRDSDAMGTSVFFDNSSNAQGEFRIMFDKKPEFVSVGTQTDPVDIRPSIVKLTQAYKRGQVKKLEIRQKSARVPIKLTKRSLVSPEPAKNVARRVTSPKGDRAKSPTAPTKTAKQPVKQPSGDIKKGPERSKSPPVISSGTRTRGSTITEGKAPATKSGIGLGVKVIVNGAKRGVVRYIGPLKDMPLQDVFVGVELSKPEGKNNGSYKGTEYFRCGDNYGVFVLQDKVTRQ